MDEKHSELHDHAAPVRWAFVRARVYIKCARAALRREDSAEAERWLAAARMLRVTAAALRDQAAKALPLVICIIGAMHGCAKAPPPPLREITANFEVQPSPDGSAIVWSLQFKTREQYHAVLETTAEGAERAKIREMIAAGLKLHHIVGCIAKETAVTKLGSDGIAFVGSCSVAAHAVPAGRI